MAEMLRLTESASTALPGIPRRDDRHSPSSFVIRCSLLSHTNLSPRPSPPLPHPSFIAIPFTSQDAVKKGLLAKAVRGDELGGQVCIVVGSIAPSRSDDDCSSDFAPRSSIE